MTSGMIFLIIIFLIIFILSFIYWYLYNKINNPTFDITNTDCKYQEHGCCNDKLTAKLDYQGSNCRGF